MKLSKTVEGITIGALVFLLMLACVAIFWEAQTIAKQEAVIRMQLDGKPAPWMPNHYCYDGDNQ